MVDRNDRHDRPRIINAIVISLPTAPVVPVIQTWIISCRRYLSFRRILLSLEIGCVSPRLEFGFVLPRPTFSLHLSFQIVDPVQQVLLVVANIGWSSLSGSKHRWRSLVGCIDGSNRRDEFELLRSLGIRGRMAGVVGNTRLIDLLVYLRKSGVRGKDRRKDDQRLDEDVQSHIVNERSLLFGSAPGSCSLA